MLRGDEGVCVECMARLRYSINCIRETLKPLKKDFLKTHRNRGIQGIILGIFFAKRDTLFPGEGQASYIGAKTK